MSSIDHLIKDKRSLIFEILFSLEGIVGDLVVVDKHHNNGNRLHCLNCDVLQITDSSLNQMLNLSEINLIKQLVIIANNYKTISYFVEKYKSDINSYNRCLAEALDKMLINYRNDLIQVEKDVNKDSHFSIIKFNKFLKYSQIFGFLNEIIEQNIEKESSFCSILESLNNFSHSGWTQVQRLAQIGYESCVTLLDDIWSWIMFAFLRHKSRSHFFIIENENKTTSLDISRIPAFINLIDATKIHYIGESVRSAQRRGVQFIYSGRESQLYELYSKIQHSFTFDKLLFSNFIEIVRRIVSEYSWNYIVNEEKLKEHLMIVKNFYLTGNDNLWTNFVFHASKIVLNGQKRFQKDIETCFETSLRQVMDENAVNEVLSTFSITALRDGNNPLISLNYKIPTSLKYIFSADNFDKYNYVLNFMVKLYLSRFCLNQIWMKSMKHKSKDKLTNVGIRICYLRNSMAIIIDCILYYVKVDVVERLYLNLMEKIEKFKDIEAIQKEHQIFITSIIAQTFLKTSVIKKCFDDLFSICDRFKTCLESTDSLNELNQEFDTKIAHLYHLLLNMETLKLNPMIANLISQLQLCTKRSPNY